MRLHHDLGVLQLRQGRPLLGPLLHREHGRAGGHPPILSGVVMDVAPAMLFAYIAAMGVFMLASVAAAKHGDAILIDEVARREQLNA